MSDDSHSEAWQAEHSERLNKLGVAISLGPKTGFANILIMVSHDMDLVGELANRVIWIESGRVHKSGEPKTVIDAFTKFMSNGNL